MLLDLTVRRLVAETDYLFGHLEDDRLARAIGWVLLRPELTDEQAQAWLDPLGEALHGVSGPFPVWAQNTIHTVKSLYIVVQRHLPHRAAVLNRLADLDWSGQPVLPGWTIEEWADGRTVLDPPDGQAARPVTLP